MADDDDDKLQMVPKSRLDGVLAKLESANARVGELEGALREAIGTAKTAEKSARSATALADRVTSLEGELKVAKREREEDAAITAAGFPDAALVRFEHARAGKEAGKLDAWLEAMKGDPEKAPGSLREHLPAADTDTDTDTGGKKGKGTAGRDKGAAGGGDGGTGSRSTTSAAEKNEALKGIEHAVGTAKWQVEADAIMGDDWKPTRPAAT